MTRQAERRDGGMEEWKVGKMDSSILPIIHPNIHLSLFATLNGLLRKPPIVKSVSQAN
jgi:hypothetical protein